MRIRGEGGELRAGPHVAAVLGAWTLERAAERLGGGWTATATVRCRDAYWSTHGGRLDLVVPAGAVAWVWRGVDVSWGDGVAITGEGKPEVRHGA